MFTGPFVGAIRGGGYGPPNLSYDTTLSVSADCGQEPIGGSYSGPGNPFFIVEQTGNTSGRDNGDVVTGFSFPNVQTLTCSAATLTFYDSLAAVPGTVRVRGRANSGSQSAQWATGNRPSASFGLEVAASVDVANTVGIKSLSVTTMVQQMLAGFAYGGRLNFWIEAVSLSVFMGIDTSTGATQPPRLQITP